jgi:hypothetical protein
VSPLQSARPLTNQCDSGPKSQVFGLYEKIPLVARKTTENSIQKQKVLQSKTA